MRDELVGNYYSEGTLERLAVHLGLLNVNVVNVFGGRSKTFSVVQSDCSPAIFVFRITFRFDQLV